MQTPNISNQIDIKSEMFEEGDGEENLNPEDITIDRVEELIMNKKWKWRKTTYEALGDMLNDDTVQVAEIVEKNISTIINEKNLAAFEQVLKLVRDMLDRSEKSKNFEQFVLDHFLDTPPHKKFLETYVDLIAIIFKSDNHLVVNGMLKRLDSKDQNLQIYILSILAMLINKIDIDNQSIIKSLLFKLKRFLSSKNVKIKEKTLQIYGELMTYVRDDFNELENNIFVDLKANQSKVIRSSWEKPKKKTNSFYILDGASINKNNSSMGLFNHVNQNNSMHQHNSPEVQLPGKFFEIPYVKKIEDKRDILKEFLGNLKKNNNTFSFSHIVANTATMFNILINELAESNYLIFSIALEILVILMHNNPDHTIVNSGIVKRTISESASKFNFKASLNDLIMKLIDDVVANRQIKFSSFLQFIINEIKFNKSLSVKICYLYWLSNHLKRHLKDPEIREFTGNRANSSKELSTLSRRQSTKKIESSVLDYLTNQLTEVLNEEKSVKIQNILKSHIQELKSIDLPDTLPQSIHPNRNTLNDGVEKLIFYLKNVKIPQDIKSQHMVLETCLDLISKCDTIDKKLGTRIMDFLHRLNAFNASLPNNIISNEIGILNSINCLHELRNEVYSLILNFVESSDIYITVEAFTKQLGTKGDNIKMLCRTIMKILKEKVDDDKDEAFIMNCKKTLKLLTSLPNEYKVLLNPLIEAFEDIVLPVKADQQKNDDNVHQEKEQTSMDRLIFYLEQIEDINSMINFNSLISNESALLQSLSKDVPFNVLSTELERIISQVIIPNLQDTAPLTEFIVTMLSLFEENGKDKFYVLVLTYCGKENFCSSMLVYPFITTVKDIYRCFKFAFNIVRNTFDEMAQTNYVKNILPIYLSTFEDVDINIYNKRLMHLVEAIIYGTQCVTTSSLCRDILVQLIDKSDIEQVKKRLEVELKSSGTIYSIFVDLIDNLDSEVQQNMWNVNQINTNKSYSVEMNTESAKRFTELTKDAEPSIYKPNDNHQIVTDQGDNKEADTVSMNDEQLENASVMYYEHIKNDNIEKIEDYGKLTFPNLNIDNHLSDVSDKEEDQCAVRINQKDENHQTDIIIDNEHTYNNTDIMNGNISTKSLENYRTLDEKKIINDNSDIKDKLEVATQTEYILDDYKENYEREQHNHKKSLQQLYTITSKYDDLNEAYQNLKEELNEINNSIKKPVYEIENFDEAFLKQFFTTHIPYELYEDVIKRCNRMQDYEKEKFIFDLKFQVTTENILDFVSQDNYESFLRFVLRMVIISTISETNSNIQALMHRILDATIKIQNTSMVVYSLIGIFNKELVAGSPITPESKMLVKLGLKCIEKLLDYSQNTQPQTSGVKDAFTIFKSIYFFYNDHPSEKLSDNPQELDFYHEVLYNLKEIADKLIAVHVEQARMFLVVFGEEKSGFVTYIKKSITDV